MYGRVASVLHLGDSPTMKVAASILLHLGGVRAEAYSIEADAPSKLAFQWSRDVSPLS